jgi:hypothetical protein
MVANGGGLAAAQLLGKTRFATITPGRLAFVQALYRRN